MSAKHSIASTKQFTYENGTTKKQQHSYTFDDRVLFFDGNIAE